MEIVTGHRGTPHVTPYKVRDFNIGIVGAEDYVMNGGSELEAQLVSNNRIDIKDGSICMQGTHAVIPKNINDELTIENGMQGEKRIDLIVARYEKVADSGVESVNTVVLQGTPSKESPIVPGHVVGDIRNGDLKHEMPLYEVELDGINVIEVRPVFKKIVSAAEQQKMIELLNGNIIYAEHKDIGIHAVNAGSYTDIAVDLKQFGMSKIVSVIPIMQGRSSSSSYGLLTLGLYEFNQNTATLRAFNADGVKREPRINVCVIGFKQQ